MSLVTIEEARARVNTALGDEALQAVIDRIEADLTRKIGPAQDDTGVVVHTVIGYGEGECFFLPSEAAEIVSVEEDGQTLAATEWRYYAGGVLEKARGHWFGQVEVVYKPADDRPARKQVIIDLLRLYLQRTAMKAEGIGGEYTFQAPENWEEEIRRVVRRVAWMGV